MLTRQDSINRHYDLDILKRNVMSSNDTDASEAQLVQYRIIVPSVSKPRSRRPFADFIPFSLPLCPSTAVR